MCLGDVFLQRTVLYHWKASTVLLEICLSLVDQPFMVFVEGQLLNGITPSFTSACDLMTCFQGLSGSTGHILLKVCR